MEQSKAIYFHNAYINADEKELRRLWEEDAPQWLIKFYPAKYENDGTNYFLQHLEHKTLWLSSPVLFNDPFDSIINFDYRNQVGQWSKSILISLVGEKLAHEIMETEHAYKALEKMKDRFQCDMGAMHKLLEKSMYTACFAERDNLKSLRMWGHYANCHAGVCAEYAFCDVNQATAFGCIPIKYDDTYEYCIDAVSIEEQVCNFMKLYTKSKEWQYEKEWRVSQKREDYSGTGYNIAFVQPKRVYLGCNVAARLKNDVIHLCENQGIELYQMTMRPSSFCLDIAEIK